MSHNAAVVEVFTAWMQGHVTENALRHALTVSGGEMDRWYAVTLEANDGERLDDALTAVNDLLNPVPPGRPILELTRANGLLRQVVDCVRQAAKPPGRDLRASSWQTRDFTHQKGLCFC